jgi:hypothetical protein
MSQPECIHPNNPKAIGKSTDNQTHAQNKHETRRTPAPLNTLSKRAHPLPTSTKSSPLHGDGDTRMRTRVDAQHGDLQ